MNSEMSSIDGSIILESKIQEIFDNNKKLYAKNCSMITKDEYTQLVYNYCSIIQNFNENTNENKKNIYKMIMKEIEECEKHHFLLTHYDSEEYTMETKKESVQSIIMKYNVLHNLLTSPDIDEYTSNHIQEHINNFVMVESFQNMSEYEVLRDINIYKYNSSIFHALSKSNQITDNEYIEFNNYLDECEKNVEEIYYYIDGMDCFTKDNVHNIKACVDNIHQVMIMYEYYNNLKNEVIIEQQNTEINEKFNDIEKGIRQFDNYLQEKYKDVVKGKAKSECPYKNPKGKTLQEQLQGQYAYWANQEYLSKLPEEQKKDYQYKNRKDYIQGLKQNVIDKFNKYISGHVNKVKSAKIVTINMFSKFNEIAILNEKTYKDMIKEISSDGYSGVYNECCKDSPLNILPWGHYTFEKDSILQVYDILLSNGFSMEKFYNGENNGYTEFVKILRNKHQSCIKKMDIKKMFQHILAYDDIIKYLNNDEIYAKYKEYVSSKVDTTDEIETSTFRKEDSIEYTIKNTDDNNYNVLNFKDSVLRNLKNCKDDVVRKSKIICELCKFNLWELLSDIDINPYVYDVFEYEYKEKNIMGSKPFTILLNTAEQNMKYKRNDYDMFKTFNTIYDTVKSVIDDANESYDYLYIRDVDKYIKNKFFEDDELNFFDKFNDYFEQLSTNFVEAIQTVLGFDIKDEHQNIIIKNSMKKVHQQLKERNEKIQKEIEEKNKKIQKEIDEKKKKILIENMRIAMEKQKQEILEIQKKFMELSWGEKFKLMSGKNSKFSWADLCA